MRAKVNGKLSIQTGSAACASPQTGSTTRVIDAGRPTSQPGTAVSESDSCYQPGVNGVSVGNTSMCNNVRISSSCFGY